MIYQLMIELLLLFRPFKKIKESKFSYFHFYISLKGEKAGAVWSLINVSLVDTNVTLLFCILLLIQRIFGLDIGFIQIQIFFGLLLFYLK